MILTVYFVTDPCRTSFFEIYGTCQNGGTSIITSKIPHCKCICPDGYFGKYCEKGWYKN